MRRCHYWSFGTPLLSWSRRRQTVRLRGRHVCYSSPMESSWSFYAPYVRVEPEFRYVVEDASGERHTFVPSDKLSRFHPIDIWVKDWYIHVMDTPETYGDAVAAYLCREHALLHPVSITLMEIEQNEFSPEDQLSGKHPFDPEFLDEKTLTTVQCPNE